MQNTAAGVSLYRGPAHPVRSATQRSPIVLDSICDRFEKLAHVEADGGIVLKGLKPEDKVALSFMDLTGELQSIFGNLNLALYDLERLKRDPYAFGAASPIQGFKLLMRICFYEYGRFEDIFGFYTLWLQKHSFMSKSERRAARKQFHDEHERIIRGRNVLLHDSASWQKWHTPEVAILEGADFFEYDVENKATGAKLQWENEMAPKCEEVISLWTTLGRHMATTWSMLFAEAARMFVEAGKLKKVSRRHPLNPHHIRALQRSGELQPRAEPDAGQLRELTRQIGSLRERLKELLQHPAIATQLEKEKAPPLEGVSGLDRVQG